MSRKIERHDGPTPEETRLQCAKALLRFNYALAISRQHVRILADPNIILLPARPRKRHGR